ncbi:sugar phosphate isomerase/epimerase [Lewinella sp. 4G2]|uniref:sugar phosphate isomerase/epimerase family protein n=1 Tax=Lewinella sp. 4G2 TaxID=1803372 RepID=UPI0007B4EBF0|nr:sugar phosphate isomerase/epimerase family protein [Lewinella sp. 4G2]OAV44927.1 hypothetical protein A3850_010665 [Lewinella sp. 4G2]
MQRRNFLAASLAIPTALSAGTSKGASNERMSAAHKGQFKISLKADAIGIYSMGADELLDAAIAEGYEALSVPGQWLEGWSKKQKKAFAKKAKKNDISWGANGLPIEFRKTEAQFKKELAELPRHAENLADIGVDRIGTWLISSSDERTYNENMRFHADRLRQAARILKDHDIKLGLEYLGTTAVRQQGRFAWLSSGRELKELIEMIGTGNVGVVLDSYHWYTAQEGVDDLKIWKNEDIIAVDLNDANDQLTLHQQTDVARELPGATGVIDLDAFLQTLVEIGYDGPLRAEPFSKTLNQMGPDLAIKATHRAMMASVNKALG